MMQQPEVYWQDEYIKIWNMDGKKTQFLPDGSVDLVITSPPYYKCEHLWGSVWKALGIKTFADYNEWLDCFYQEWFRLLGDGRYVIVNTCNVNEQDESFNNVAWTAVGLEKAGFMYVDEIIWEKHKASSQRFGVLVQTPYPRMYYPNNVHETWLVYRKGASSHDHSKRTEDDLITLDKETTARLRNDVWRRTTVSAAKVGHVTPFPEDIVCDFISLYTFTGETVLEPFAGSGTTGMAASKLKRKSLLFDIDPFYCDAMVKRFSEDSGLLSM
jgi:modification methylase